VTPVAFVLKGYPRLSETFIAQEIRALEARGLDIRIVSLRHPTDRKRHATHEAIRAPVLYLPEYLWHEPLRVFSGWRWSRRLPGYGKAFRTWLRDLRRDPTPNRIRRFGQALVLAKELPDEVGRLHAHFLHTPASVTRYAAMMRELPWTVSAHAKDIWTTPDWEAREKLLAAEWAVTCTAAGLERLGGLAPGRTALVYHGIEAARFPPPPPRRDADELVILSVGRAVEKKGYDDLLDALGLLPKDLAWRFVHIGGGALAKDLRRRADALGISDRIDWRGAQSQDVVLAAYREADLFVLASRIAGDGDRDGLPNVLMEAQSQRLAVVSTNVSGVPELVADGETGVLVPPSDPAALARAIEALLRDPARRAALAAAGEIRVRRSFAAERGFADLAQRFGLEPEVEEKKTPSPVHGGGSGRGRARTAEAQ
jgi:glycosyltransferase involved in cell wall biosynthesis